MAKVCYSAESAVLHTRGLELVRLERMLLSACGAEITGVLVLGGDEGVHDRGSGAGEWFCSG